MALVITDRELLVRTLATRVPRPSTLGHPVRVAVDGVDGAGKTTLAAELARAIERLGQVVVQVSVDDFHHPRARRYARGRDSAEGFWLDSFDHARLVTDVLAPCGPDGTRTIRRASHDLDTDADVVAPLERLPRDAVLVVDGVFLHRDELVHHWDWSVFLTVGFEETFARMAVRDGFAPDPAAPTNHRYAAGQRLYLDACDPAARASVVVDNTDLAHPFLVGRPPAR